MANITYSNKSAGDQFSSSEVNQIKSVVNTNYGELQGIDSRLNSAESSITVLEDVTIPDINSTTSSLTEGLANIQLRTADWDTAAATILTNADNWIQSHTQTYTYSADWNESYASVSTTSARWDESYNSVSTASAKWDLAYSTVISLSTDWAIDIDTQLDITTTDLYLTVTSNSASWADSGTSVTSTYVDDNFVDSVKWDPATDPSSIISWHDASDESTIAVDADNNLTGWVDKLTQQDGMYVDLNNDASDGGGSVLSLTSTINGRNVVNINENSFLRYGSYTNIGDTYSLFLVCRVDIVNDVSDSIISFKTPGGLMSWQVYAGNQNKFAAEFSSSNMGATTTSMATNLAGAPFLLHLKFDWSTQTLYGYINGELKMTNAYTNFDSIGNDLIYMFINRGEQTGPTGAVAELITTTDIGATNTAKIESYLCDKWGIQIATGHPYEGVPKTVDSQITFNDNIYWPQGGSDDTNAVNTVVKTNSGTWGSVEFSESVEVPAPGSPGRRGDIRYITPYMYVCIETDTWVRQTVETGW